MVPLTEKGKDSGEIGVGRKQGSLSDLHGTGSSMLSVTMKITLAASTVQNKFSIPMWGF